MSQPRPAIGAARSIAQLCPIDGKAAEAMTSYASADAYCDAACCHGFIHKEIGQGALPIRQRWMETETQREEFQEPVTGPYSDAQPLVNDESWKHAADLITKIKTSFTAWEISSQIGAR